MPGSVQQLQDAGFSPEEIGKWQQKTATQLQGAGFADADVQAYVGASPVPTGPNPKTDARIEQHFKSSIQAAMDANKDPEGNAKPFTFTDALEAGWQTSAMGLQQRGKLPDKQLPEDASAFQRISANVASLAGDFPAMIEGGAIGMAAGIPGGPATMAVGAGAGAFGLPAALRATMMDAYKNGEYHTPREFLERASGIMAETSKSMAIGALTAATGGLAETANIASGPIVKAIAPTTAELATLVTLSKTMEGHLPTWQDFQDGAILLFGLKGATTGAGKLANLYVKTGITPSQTLNDAQNNPVLKTELLSTQEVPTTYEKYIDPSFKKVKAAVQTFAKDDSGAVSLTAVGQAAKNIAQKIVVNREEPAKAGMSFDKFYADWVDNLNPIKEVMDAARAAGTNIPPSQDAYKLMRVARGGYERANQFIQHGTVDFKTYKPNGDSLATVLEPVKEDLEGFRTYIVAKRAVELEGRGVQSGFDLAEAKLVSEDPAMKAKYDAAAKGVTDYMNRVTAYAKNAGLLNEKTFQLFMDMNKNYVPFNRVFPDEETHINAPTGQQTKSPFKSIKGSEKDVIDPIQSIIQNTYTILTLAERNNSLHHLVNAADKAGMLGEGKVFEKVNPRIKGTTVNEKEMNDFLADNKISGVPADQLTVFRAMRQPLAADEIAVYRDGNREVYAISGDPDLLTALKGAPNSLNDPLFRFVAGFTRFFRAGTVLNPDFMPRHMVRQNINAFVNSETGMVPVLSALQGAADLIKDKNGELFQQWRSGGGMNSEITAWDRRYIQNSVKSIEGGESLAEFIERTKDDPMSLVKLPYNSAQSVLDVAHMVIATHDNFLRYQEFKQSMKALDAKGVKGKDAIIQSAYNSREVLLDNFRRGAKMQAVNQIFAFMNLRVQGVDKLARLMKDNPERTAIRLSAGIAIPTVLLWWANHDDPRYKEMQDWQRDNFWIIPLDDWRQAKDGDVLPTLEGMSRVKDGKTEYNFGEVLRITKPPESGLFFGSSIERFLDFAQSHDPKTAEKLALSIYDDLVPDLTPTMAAPVYEQWANKSRFTGGPIVPHNAESILPAYQYTNYTTETTKALGKLVGSLPGMQENGLASPAIIENYIRHWSGGLGMYALQMVDYGLRKAGVVSDPVRPSSSLADIPFIRAFVVRYPTASTQSVEDFYTQYDKMKKIQNTISYLADKGDFEASAKLAELNPLALATLDDSRAAMAAQQKFIQFVYDNPDWKSDEKRQLIDSAYYQMISIAQLGNETMKQMAASLENGN